MKGFSGNPLSIQASPEGSHNKYLIIVVTIGHYDSAMLFETFTIKRFQCLSSCTLNAREPILAHEVLAPYAGTNGHQRRNFPQRAPRQLMATIGGTSISALHANWWPPTAELPSARSMPTDGHHRRNFPQRAPRQLMATIGGTSLRALHTNVCFLQALSNRHTAVSGRYLRLVVPYGCAVYCWGNSRGQFLDVNLREVKETTNVRIASGGFGQPPGWYFFKAAAQRISRRSPLSLE
jgi:hypothetical protein